MVQSSASFDLSAALHGEFTGFEPWYCSDADDIWCHAAPMPTQARALDTQAFLDLECDVPY